MMTGMIAADKIYDSLVINNESSNNELYGKEIKDYDSAVRNSQIMDELK